MSETVRHTDVIVVGSGSAAFAGAITAREAGLSVVMLEKTDKWGGTSAYSGGGVWIPDNPFVREHGLQDGFEIALDYLNRVVGDEGPATSPERKRAFLQHGPDMVAMLRRLGMAWAFKTNFPDYYPQLQGAGLGRGLGCNTMDGKRLGTDLATMREPVNYPPLVFSGAELMGLLAPFKSAANFRRLLAILWTSTKWKLSGKVPLSMGRATMGELMLVAQRQGFDLELNAAMDTLIVEQGRVAGVRYTQAGASHELRAHRGVLIAAGGFARNDAYRRQYQKVGSAFTAAAPGDLGTPIEAAVAIGAELALMDEAWWMPVILMPDGGRSITLWERSMPHSVIVDKSAERYMNEAQPYNDCGRRILERGGGDHSWMIIDSRHRRNYAFATLPCRYTPAAWMGAVFTKADSIEELASKIGLDAARLQATLDRFNHFAERGEDEDFGRGGNAFDNSWGDPTHKPNPNLGTISEPPFFAIPIWPGDIGTKGGLLTDEFAQVMSTGGRPIRGLYGAGNSTASVMGKSYPGAGGTIGPGMVFAYIAMLHAAGKLSRGHSEWADSPQSHRDEGSEER